MNRSEIFERLMHVTKSYSYTFRTTIFPREKFPDSMDFEDTIYRESLMSHIGHVNIVASMLYPHLSKVVSLGHTLELLAIHDFGELKSGDIHIMRKNSQHELEEREFAKSLLNDEQFAWFEEFEKNETLEAKFANSVDKISADILCLCIDPQLEKRRMKLYNFSKQDIFKRKSPFMEWDHFIFKFYQDIIEVCEKQLS